MNLKIKKFNKKMKEEEGKKSSDQIRVKKLQIIF